MVPRSLRLALLIAAALPVSSSFAANLTWDSSASSPAAPVDGPGTWDTSSANWSNNSSDAAWVNANNDTAVFGGASGTPGSVTLGTPITVGGLTFNAAGYTLTGSALTLASTTTITSNANATITSDAAIAGGSTVNFGGAGTLTLSGLVTGSGLYTLNVNAGTLSLTNTAYNGLGQNRPVVTIAAGATLSADAVSGNAFNINALTLNGGTLTSAQTAANDGGYGNFILQADVTVGGSAVSTISSKTLNLGNGLRTFTVADSVAGTGTDLNVTSNILAGSLVKAGTGTMTLNTFSSYAGTTTVNAGTLQLTVASGTLSSASAITINSGGTLQATATNAISGNAVTVNAGGVFTVDANQVVTMGDTTLAGGTLTSAGAGAGTYGNYYFNNRTITHTGGAVTSTINAAGGIGVTGTLTLNVAGGATGSDLLISSAISEPETAANLVKNGVGVLRLTGTNGFTGGTTINAGTLVTGNTSALGTGAVTLAGGTLRIGDGNVNTVSLAPGKNITATAAATLAFGSASLNAITLAGGKYDFTGQTITLDLGHFFDSAGSYSLITGGTGNIDASSYVFSNFNAGLSYAFANGLLSVGAVPEPPAYGLMGAGALAAVAFVRRRRKTAAR